MCIVKTPKVKATDAANKTPDPAIIRNPYLDGADPTTRSLRMGSSSLRIERAGSGTASAVPPVSAVTPVSPTPQSPIAAAFSQISPSWGGANGVAGALGKIKRLNRTGVT